MKIRLNTIVQSCKLCNKNLYASTQHKYFIFSKWSNSRTQALIGHSGSQRDPGVGPATVLIINVEMELRKQRKSQLPTEVGLTTYISKIRPVLEYASPIWAGLPDYLQQEIERVQARSLRILNLDRDCLPSLSHRRELATAREIKRIQMEQTHPCHSLLPDHRGYSYDLRQTNTFKTLSKTKRHKQSFIARACKYT